MSSGARLSAVRTSSTGRHLLTGLLAVLCWIGPAGPARAENQWVLWERPLDARGQPSGAWRQVRLFEGERWCKGAMTSAINNALRPKDHKIRLVEYQCLPAAGTDPSVPKSSR